MHRVRARNLATTSENKIHDDDVARRFGFKGGLVPGVTVFAYMTRPVAQTWGPTWLEGGSLSARFVKPFYDGEEVVVHGQLSEVGPPDVAELTATNAAAEVCAEGVARMAGAMAAPPPLDEFPEAPLPEERPSAGPDTLAPGTVLGSVSARYDGERGRRFLAQIGDDLALYEAGQVAHPGHLLLSANAVLVANVRLGPWVHVSSEMSHFGMVRDAATVSTRARVRRLFERSGHEFVELDVLLLADGDRPVAHVLHTAIYRLRERSSEKSAS